VYLPAGKWYDYWTKEEYAGGKTVMVSSKLDTIPVFVPAGGIITKAPVVPYVNIEKKEEFDSLSLEVYTGSDGTYLLYEDDGISMGYKRGEHTITEFQWDDKNGKLTGKGKSAILPGRSRKIEALIYPSGEKKSLEMIYE
jgi:alpha-glucosidase (family GH31 glycosyl hydrolase)